MQAENLNQSSEQAQLPPNDSDAQKLADLTVGELKALLQPMIAAQIKQIINEELKPIWEYLFEIEDQMPDPDEGKSLKPEFEAELREAFQERLYHGMGIPLEEVIREIEEQDE